MARSMKDVLHESYQMSLHETKKKYTLFPKTDDFTKTNEQQYLEHAAKTPANQTFREIG